MDEIDYAKLIKIAEKSTNKNFRARIHNGHLVPSVANFGGKIGDVVKLERSGEYNGIGVELMENLKPLLTDHFIVRILTMLKKEDYMTPLHILNLSGLDQLQYILHKWFEVATTEYNNAFEPLNKKYPVFDSW